MEPEENNEKVEIWGGVECTVVRINDHIHDQLDISGHEKRPDDLQLFAGLGIRTIRYPLLWEKYISDKDSFFRLHHERLSAISELKITPVAGLVHHGSGPFFTNLRDDAFPELLAEYAFTISEKFPWIKYYTPVNEPLTTARFSGLYGIWYPHLNDDYSFLKIFLNEMKGIVLAMQAVRSNNPEARLIQTEDLCKVHSTDILKYQADFENERRWLTYDLLTGRIKPDHPLWEYLIKSGIREEELDFFLENKMEPAICGYNYYVSSERYLDHNTSAYPVKYHGGNGRHYYADVEAVRVAETQVNLYQLLKEAWERYHLPMALTEVHLACTREEQLRWFNEAYETASRLRNEKVDLRAITTWSFFGSFDWNSLLKNKRRYYESGVFDIRSGKPRATALSVMIGKINRGEPIRDSLLEIPGWWRRDIRISFNHKGHTFEPIDHENVPPVLVLGATGSLGNAFARICHTRGLVHKVLNHQQLEITSQQSIEKIAEEMKPWAIINTTGFSRIDEAEKDPMNCFRVNTLGPSILANVCHAYNIKLVTFSTDQVFNGKKRIPYLESDKASPINVYGQSKRKAEEVVMMVNPDTLIIRSSAFFNPWFENDQLLQMLQADSATPVSHYLPSDIIFSPTYITDLVNTTLDLMIDNENGIWHLSNEEEVTYFQFVKLVFEMAGRSTKNIVGVPSWRMKFVAERPHYSVLTNSKGISLPPLAYALENYLNELSMIYNDPSQL